MMRIQSDVLVSFQQRGIQVEVATFRCMGLNTKVTSRKQEVNSAFQSCGLKTDPSLFRCHEFKFNVKFCKIEQRTEMVEVVIQRTRINGQSKNN